MLRLTALYMYGVSVVLSLVMTFNYVGANRDLAFEAGLDRAAWSFVPIGLLLLSVFYAQLRARSVLWLLAVIVVAAALSLYFTAVFHMFPEWSRMAAAIHLAVVTLGVALGLFFAGRKTTHAPAP